MKCLPILGVEIVLISLIASFTTTLLAQSDSRANLYAGYSFFSNDFHIDRSIGESSYFSNGRGNLHGWNVSGEIKAFRWIGLVADFNGSYGSVPIQGIPFSGLPTTINTHVYTYLFGPRISTQVGRLRPFAEALIGADSQSLNSDFDSVQDTRFAMAFGGGVDYRFAGPLAWRVEADYVPTRQFRICSSVQSRFNRISAFPRGLCFGFRRDRGTPTRAKDSRPLCR